jgi:hypothetical protein
MTGYCVTESVFEPGTVCIFAEHQLQVIAFNTLSVVLRFRSGAWPVPRQQG